MVKQRVVVIEDEPVVQDLLRDVLEAEGYDVLGLATAGAARTLRPADVADLFLVDLMLPDGRGVQLAADLRESGFAHVPMVAMSADRLALLLASRSGLFQEAIAKPFDLYTLLDAVGAHVGQYVTT
jgi:DNA-binding response OmpR family regulator